MKLGFVDRNTWFRSNAAPTENVIKILWQSTHNYENMNFRLVLLEDRPGAHKMVRWEMHNAGIPDSPWGTCNSAMPECMIAQFLEDCIKYTQPKVELKYPSFKPRARVKNESSINFTKIG